MQGLETKRPPFWLSCVICLILTGGLVYMRLAADTLAGPALGLALLVCLWNRERSLLWIMTFIFTATIFYNMLWRTPKGVDSDSAKWIYITYMNINLWVITIVVHLFIGLHERLERRNATLEVANAYLESANKELTAKEKQIESMSRQLQDRADAAHKS
jgi:hypothetical protein